MILSTTAQKSYILSTLMLILSCNQNSEYNRFETWTQDQPHHFCINNILSSSFNSSHITMHVSQGSGGYRRYHTGSCGGYRYAESGLIHTPGYPDELYENSLTQMVYQSKVWTENQTRVYRSGGAGELQQHVQRLCEGQYDVVFTAEQLVKQGFKKN